MTTATTFYPDPIPSVPSNSSKLEQWKRLLHIYEELEHRMIHDVEELEKWILDWNEISILFKEEFGRIYIRFTTKTDDESISIRLWTKAS